MVPFSLEVEFHGEQQLLTAEQLEHFADKDGFTRYDLRAGERRSVIHVDTVFEPPVATRQDADAYFEAVHYPEQLAAYDNQEVFTREELRTIAAAIRQYNRETGVVFAQFLLDF